MVRDVKNDNIKVVIHEKNEGEKFTNIDWTIQKIYENYLKIYFPGIKFVGEEDTTKKIDVDKSYYSIKDDEEINYNLLKDISDYNDNLNLSDVCVFMDPIDSTSSLMRKSFGPVTTLVGLTLKNNANLGLIHYPSFENKDKSYTFFNIPGRGIYRYNIDSNSIRKIDFNKTEELTFVCSSSRSNKAMDSSNKII